MLTPDEMRAKIVDKAAEDADFRALLLSDPKGAVEQELGFGIPPGINVQVHEEDAGTAHLVLPPSSALGEADLQALVGAEDREKDYIYGQSWNVNEW